MGYSAGGAYGYLLNGFNVLERRRIMKISRYVTEIKINDFKKMLYNTLSRQYYVYGVEDSGRVSNFLLNLNKGVYTEEEIELFRVLLNKKIIIQDAIDELNELEYLENSARYQENVYKIMVYATNACNFRCAYCTQSHVAKRLKEDVENSIIRLVEKQARRCKRVEIDWFGGEPLLEYDKVCHVLMLANNICIQQKCALSASITTNGYLLNPDRVKELRQLNVKSMQITLDGNKTTHDKRRVLVNGEGTFDIIHKNLIIVLEEGIFVTLRINVDEENIDDISVLLDSIPEKYRKQVMVSVCNVFQNEEKVSSFNLLKQAIDKGYVYGDRKNRYSGCHASLKNAVVIDTDGSILLCSNADEAEKRMGYLNEKGDICIERKADYYKLHTVTAIDNPKCKECIELPFCIADCKYMRLEDNVTCLGKKGDGLSLEERALLDYYYDNKMIKGD